MFSILILLASVSLAFGLNLSEFFETSSSEEIAKLGLDSVPTKVHERCAFFWPLVNMQFDPIGYIISDDLFRQDVSTDQIQLAALCMMELINVPYRLGDTLLYPKLRDGHLDQSGPQKRQFYGYLLALSSSSPNRAFKNAIKSMVERANAFEYALEASCAICIPAHRKALWDFIWAQETQKTALYETMCNKAAQSTNRNLIVTLLLDVPQIAIKDRILYLTESALRYDMKHALTPIFHELMVYNGESTTQMRVEAFSQLMTTQEPSSMQSRVIRDYARALSRLEQLQLMLIALGKTSEMWILIWLHALDPGRRGEPFVSLYTLMQVLARPDYAGPLASGPWLSLIYYYALTPTLAPLMHRNYVLVFETQEALKEAILRFKNECERKQYDVDVVDRFYNAFLRVWTRFLPAKFDQTELMPNVRLTE